MAETFEKKRGQTDLISESYGESYEFYEDIHENFSIKTNTVFSTFYTGQGWWWINVASPIITDSLGYHLTSQTFISTISIFF